MAKSILISDNQSSITGFRERVRTLLMNERLNGGASRNVVILALDGIPYDLAVASWPHAVLSKMSSVFPTTSSTAWLSSLTGVDTECHGVPGVVFKDSSGEMINVFEYKGPLLCPTTGNIFSDAAGIGYFPISVMGDWEPYDCAWREALLDHSETVRGHRFYTSATPLDAEALHQSLTDAIRRCLNDYSAKTPLLVWCFIDADQRIHHRGYDEEVMRFLKLVDDFAVALSSDGMIVIAHSDHGLIPTAHNREIEEFLEQLQLETGCTMGGAGRTRWLYAQAGTAAQLVTRLKQCLPSTISIFAADEVFSRGSLARVRVGDIMLMATAEDFITISGHRFDHGSCTETELNVPFAQWTT